MSFENRPQSSKPEKRGREIALFAQLPVNIQPRKLGGGIRQANHTRIKKLEGLMAIQLVLMQGICRMDDCWP